MVSKKVIVKNPIGLHARPAAEFVQVSSRLACDVTIGKGHLKVNAKSILGVISIGAEQNAEIEIFTDGEDEAASLETLVDFIENLEE